MRHHSRFVLNFADTSSLSTYTQFFAERCNFIVKFGYCHKMSSAVCRLSVTPVYFDNTAEATITLAVFQ